MPLLLFRSLWTNGFDLDAALADVSSGLFDGIEGPVPDNSPERVSFIERIASEGIPYIAEVTTGGGYVPFDRSAAAQLEDLRRKLDIAAPTNPQFVTCLAGCDAWSPTTSIDFLGQALEIARQRGLTVAFETHRSRSTFNPWVTATILRQVPALRLTCDFSHWCCVCERLVLNEEPGLVALFARHALHVHARVGYAQGPQVPDPAAPEYATELQSHERWWEILASARPANAPFTMTPEFGPDGYLQTAPYTKAPAANLDDVNRWMARRLRERFGAALAIAERAR